MSAALVLTRWDEETAAGQIDLPPPAASALAHLLSNRVYEASLSQHVSQLDEALFEGRTWSPIWPASTVPS
jgi:hypothetical protein